MPNFDALKDEWNTMLKYCEETCWAWKQELDESADKEQGQDCCHEGDWPEHSLTDHEDVRHKILVKMGVITDPNTPEEYTFIFYNKVLEAELDSTVQFNVQMTDGAHHVDHEYMEISTHLAT